MDTLTANQRKPQYYPNMDLMRYVLSFAVIIAHINELAGFSIPFPISSFEAVGSFFALSGFLMYPNYIRHNNFLKYTRQRARRILPPYIFIVVAAALLLAGVSSLPASEYFTSSGFFGYLGANLTFLNWLHPDLPGVFQGSGYALPVVNGSLWTMKVEWCLYFSVPIFVFLLRKIKRSSGISLSIAVIIISIIYRLVFTSLYETSGNEIFKILSRQIFGQLSYFYCGMLIYFLKDFFTRNLAWMLLAGVALVCLARLSMPCNIILNPFGITMIVMALSLLPYDLKFLRHRYNVSYEMYLFHFPIIQLSVFWGMNVRNVWVELPFVVTATVLLSFLVHYAVNRRRKKSA